jgi:hypothetical protein
MFIGVARTRVEAESKSMSINSVVKGGGVIEDVSKVPRKK